MIACISLRLALISQLMKIFIVLRSTRTAEIAVLEFHVKEPKAINRIRIVRTSDPLATTIVFSGDLSRFTSHIFEQRTAGHEYPAIAINEHELIIRIHEASDTNIQRICDVFDVFAQYPALSILWRETPRLLCDTKYMPVELENPADVTVRLRLSAP
jgi:hypothetical protein